MNILYDVWKFIKLFVPYVGVLALIVTMGWRVIGIFFPDVSKGARSRFKDFQHTQHKRRLIKLLVELSSAKRAHKDIHRFNYRILLTLMDLIFLVIGVCITGWFAIYKQLVHHSSSFVFGMETLCFIALALTFGAVVSDINGVRNALFYESFFEETWKKVSAITHNDKRFLPLYEELKPEKLETRADQPSEIST